MESLFSPPARYRNDLGTYRSPLQFEDGRVVSTAADWRERKREIVAAWETALGTWPPCIEHPSIEYLERRQRDGDLVQDCVTIEIAPGNQRVAGYLLRPIDSDTAKDLTTTIGTPDPGKISPILGPTGYATTRKTGGSYPAVLILYYDAETSIGCGKELRDYGYQLAKRGYVTLSIGTPDFCNLQPPYRPHYDVPAGQPPLQPLHALAYVAANCWYGLANLPAVDPDRIGVMGHSYGGKWAMFAACFHEKFACTVWSDPGIVFDETRANVNYWEPWYLGYDPQHQRERGIPNADRPRTGAYRELIRTGHDLHELHALMAPRPFLVAGGAEDPPQRWQALNHTIAVNQVLGQTGRVAMANRAGHAPTPESNRQILAFFDRFLSPTPQPMYRGDHPTD